MSEFSHDLAVVIGINQYGSGIAPLQTAVNDVEELARILQDDHGYQVVQLVDQQATLKTLHHLLDEELPKAIQPDSRLLFYFAGHGIALNGDEGPEGYLIPQDARLGDTNTYLSMPKLQADLSKLPCRHFLGILDCCFAGAFRWSSTRDLLSVPEVIHKERYDRFIQDPAWQTITSAASDQKALDSLTINSERGQTGNHSPFAAALIEALAGKADVYPPAEPGKPAGDGVITATELYLYLRDAVEPATEGNRHRQTPGIWPLKKHDKGEYIFLAPGHVLNLPPAPPLDESRNPYRGLQSFEAEQSDLFFGRQALTETLGEFVCHQPLSVVLGASGSGKSSLVKAGLIPYLKQRDAKADQPQWQLLAPLRPGESPFKALSNALTQENTPGFSLPDAGAESQVEMLSQHMAAWSQHHPRMKLLLAIDQFEELITLCRNEKEREQFLSGLSQAVTAYPEQLRLVLTLRSDFEPQFQDGLLKKHWNAARSVVPPMTRAELREAIEEPASKRVMYFQSDDPKNPLIEQLINEVAEMPGALPLLSFTLSELYLKYLKRQNLAQNRGDSIDRAITEADYKELGGVARSLTQRADQEYEALVQQDKAYEQTIRHVMLRMVAVGGGELARRRVPLSEFEYPPAQNDRVKEVIRRFSAARLVVEGQDPDGNPYAEPAHDALVRGWKRLKVWMQADEENLLLQRRLTPAAEEWNEIKEKEKQPKLLGKAWGQTESFAIGKIQTWQRDRQRAKQAKIDVSRKSDVKSIAYLWDDDPRIEQLNQKLDSGDSWLNWLEDDFVRRSILQKGKNTYRLSLIVTGVIASLAGLSIFALIQLQYSNLRGKAATVRNELATSPVNSLVLAIQATGESNSRLRQVLSPVEYSLSAAVAESREQLMIRGHEGSVKSVALSPDGQTIVSGGEDGTIRLWDLAGKSINLFRGHEEKNYKTGLDTDYVLKGVNSVAFSPDGQTIASGGDDSTVRLWNLQGQQINNWKIVHQQPVTSVVFSPNSNQVVSLSNDSLQLWNLQAERVTNLLSVEAVYQYLKAVAFSPDGKYIAAAQGGDIILWDSNGNRLNFQKQGIAAEEGSAGNKSICSIVFSQDSKRILTGQCKGDGSLQNASYEVDVWRIEEQNQSLIQEPEKNLKSHLGAIFSLAASTDGMVATGVADGTIHLSDSPAEVSPILRGHTGIVNSLAFNPKEKQLVSASNDGTIRLWDLSDYFSSAEVEFGRENDGVSWNHIHAVAFNPNGNDFAIARRNFVTVFNREDNQVKQTFEHPLTNEDGVEPVNSIAYSPDGKTIVSGGHDKTLRLWSLEGDKPPVVFQGHKEEVTSIAFSPDGKTIVSGSVDNTLHLWDLEGKPLQVFSGHEDSVPAIGNKKGVTAVAFSPNGKTIVSGADDKTLRLWDLKGKQLQVFKGHENRVTSVAFSPDGKTIVSGSADKTLRFWDLQGKPKGTQVVRAHSEAVRSVGFSPNGKMIMSAGTDRMLKFWSLDGSPASISFENPDTSPGDISVFAISPDNKTILTSMGGNKTFPSNLRMIQNRNKWEEWLELACNRLRNHPTLLNPQTDVEKGARVTCQANAWNLPKR